MDEDMNIILRAVDENYRMPMQYKYAWNTLQKMGQFRDKRIWKNFTYFIDWINKYFNKEKWFETMGKSYYLEDNILCRISCGMEETWLMSNIFRHVENPKIEEFPEHKYIGKVKFTKIYKKAKYAGEENEQWTPPRKNENGDDIEERKSVVDIQIVVYLDNDMKIPRRYEVEYGWKDKWIEQGICDLKEAPPDTDIMYTEYKNFETFKKKWADLTNKIRVPKWYRFDPENPHEIADDHNMIKKWDNKMYEFLKEQKWMERIPCVDCYGNQYEEKSEFVVNCSNLLGIGGEGMVIRKSIAERVGKIPERQPDREYEALKIIPIKKSHFDSQNIRRLENRVKRQAIKLFCSYLSFRMNCKTETFRSITPESKDQRL